MAQPIVSDLLELMPDEVTLQATTQSYKGARTVTGTAQTVRARVVGQHRVVRDRSGQERVSTVHAVLAGAYGATVWHRYTLPDRFVPNQPEALSVAVETDENGAHHEVVFF